MAYTIDSGLAVVGSGPSTITVQTEFERTSPLVGSEYAFLVAQMQQILQQPPSDVNQASADQLSAAINGLRSLAISGMVVPKPGSSTGETEIQYVTTDMAQQIDMLSRSLRAVGVANSQPTIADVKQWQDLATQGLNDIMNNALRAVRNNNSFQAMIELEYVQAGNDLLETQLTQLNTALKATTSVTDLLGQLQSIHNMIAPGTVNTSPILQYTDPGKLVAANQQAIFNFMTDSMKQRYNVNSPQDITEAIYFPHTVPFLSSTGYGIKYELELMTHSPLQTNPPYVSKETFAQAGIFFPSTTITEQIFDDDTRRFTEGISDAGKEELYAAMSTDQRNFWGITRDSDGELLINPSFLSQMQSAGGNAGVVYQEIADMGKLNSWDWWYSQVNTTPISINGNSPILLKNFITDSGVQNDRFRLTLNGVKSFAQLTIQPQPNLWSELSFNSTANSSSSDFTNTIQSLFGKPLDPIIDFGTRTDQDVLKSFMDIRAQLAAQLTALDQLNPPPASGRDPNSIGANVATVLQDMETYIPTGLNINTNGPAMIEGLKRWIMDNQDKHSGTGSIADQNLAKTSGDIQRNLQNAITAATNLNDTQKEDLRRYMFIFDEFYKSASAMLTRITQILEKMAQNAGR